MGIKGPMDLSRRAFVGASALAVAPTTASALPAHLMTPATAIASFETHGSATRLRPSFSELLWYVDQSGRCWIKLEWSTLPFQNSRPGNFVKGGATGAFTVSYAADLQRTARQFWWPDNARSKQPPDKAGQNMWGEVWYSIGVDPATIPVGYTRIIPKPIAAGVQFELNGIGQEPIPLTADHFFDDGDIRFYADFSFMLYP